jgi:hypothetical protein
VHGSPRHGLILIPPSGFADQTRVTTNQHDNRFASQSAALPWPTPVKSPPQKLKCSESPFHFPPSRMSHPSFVRNTTRSAAGCSNLLTSEIAFYTHGRDSFDCDSARNDFRSFVPAKEALSPYTEQGVLSIDIKAAKELSKPSPWAGRIGRIGSYRGRFRLRW